MKFSTGLNKIYVPDIERELEADINAVIAKDELYYETEIDKVCKSCIKNNVSVLLLCGPSAAGKTTTSKILEREFKEFGHGISRLSLDNFYKPKDELPLWPDGEKNLESIEGLDIELFSELVSVLFKTGRCTFPVFDFVSANNNKTFSLNYSEGDILIIEGIHALNPEIYEVVKDKHCCRLYISTHSNFINDDEILLPARNLRLIRRVLRDYKHRGASLNMTLDFWKYIKLGEELYIYPFRQSADFHIDTAHSYEPFLYGAPLEALIESSEFDKKHEKLVASLLKSARSFKQIPYSAVPKSSLIQEFIR